MVPLFVMSFHKVIGFTITILGVFIQRDFQTKSSSLMETHYWTMSIFLVALLAFAVTWLMSTSQVQAENSSHTKAMNQISLVSGIIAVTLLFLIIHAVIGCVILISLALYLIKSIYSYKPVHDALFLLIAKLKRAICGQSDEESEETTPRATGGQ